MKTAIYIEDGVVQLVLTPDGEFEKNALSAFNGKPLSAVVREGSFYECKGGYFRQYGWDMYASGPKYRGDESLILRVDTEVNRND